MLKKFIDFQLRLTGEGRRLARFRPLAEALDTICFEPRINTKSGPHIRDAVDLKRWMILVVIAMVPCIFMAIWNSGMQSFVYGNGNDGLVKEFFSTSYFSFALKDTRYLTILLLGAKAFIPIMLISYIVGGFWEAVFAIVRRHEISEGFLVTGMLYALILPSTLPYWMVAVGVSIGIVLSKELFGGVGMNILNPALACRAFLFFTFPAQMTGDVWVGTNPTTISTSVKKINESMPISQASPLNLFNITTDIKRIHVEAIGWSQGITVPNASLFENNFQNQPLQSVLKSLGLSEENHQAAKNFAALRYGQGNLTNKNFFFGNMIGSLGETSTLFAIFGALFIAMVGIGSHRSMLGMLFGFLGTALLFQLGSQYLGTPNWNPAKYDLPAYKHLLMGSFAFALAFMITEPVSGPSLKSAKWVYGALAGSVTILIRVINPAFPEGVMLAILFANVVAPLLDHIALYHMRKRRYA